MAKHAEALKLFILPRKCKFQITAIATAIREKNTGTKVDPLRITPSRIRFSLRPSLKHETDFEPLALVTTKTPPVVVKSLVPTSTKFSKSILANPSSHPKSYAAMCCNTLQRGHFNIGKIIIPYRYDITRNSRFGKPSLDHSFTSEVCFAHILLHILKAGVLS